MSLPLTLSVPLVQSFLLHILWPHCASSSKAPTTPCHFLLALRVSCAMGPWSPTQGGSPHAQHRAAEAWCSPREQALGAPQRCRALDATSGHRAVVLPEGTEPWVFPAGAELVSACLPSPVGQCAELPLRPAPRQPQG